MPFDEDILVGYQERMKEMMLDDIEAKLIELGYLAPNDMKIEKSIDDVGSRYIAIFIINDSYDIICEVSFCLFDSSWLCKVLVTERGLLPTDEPVTTFVLTDIQAVKTARRYQ